MRLSEDARASLPRDVAQAAYARAEQRRGIVHLGIGAFHRAHQAVYTDDAMAAGDRDWAITAVSLRSPQVREQLAPQDGLYTVATRDAGGEQLRVIEAVREVLVAPHAPRAVAAALAAPETRLVTLTVTEKGYHRQPGGGVDGAAVAAAGGTIYHYLSQAVRDRLAAGAGPMTLVSCDNMTDNGHVLHGGVASLLDGAALDWFERDWACPSTMVDRIVPATTADDLARVEQRIGLRDEGAVVTEPFRQWVIEDRFAGARPRWDAGGSGGGAQFVADVRPYEAAKLRMLNGAHSALAYLGLRAGHAFVHQAVADPAIRGVVERLMRQEAAASLDPAPGQDLDGYATALLARFENPSLAHRLAQIAMDGSQKVGPRWLEALTINRARGVATPATLTALAGWLRHLRGEAGPVNDPLGDELAALWRGNDARGMVEALFGAGGTFAARWQADEGERRALAELVERN
ncbi:fructuronate reductase [Sphingomonas sp. BE138]|uniref:mannitol dehydrogenase family protein n=1 Tax=Sphingomonas sp. BE138 TaxID=2817845 RepID=UPI002860755D|nr:mannitol dehydrogenase family protein [Sphingomonas sp. BE138]MDR6787440.1 fructuronate reductase [Sphingomonas sp. BE138]